jgi:undecaprenyl-diphosphatase
MNLLQIIVLALIQGTTEFLPISSEGHNILVPIVAGWPDQGKLFDAVTNVGTVGAVIVYFWRDVLALCRGLADVTTRRATRDSHLLVNLVVATLPILVVGFVMDVTHIIDHIRNATLIAVNAIVFGILLYVSDAYGLSRRTVADMNWKTSLIIGLAQALALSPGTSRSGICMTAARGLGFVRPEAARFAFLMSIPANGAASTYVIGKALLTGQPITAEAIMCAVLTFFVGLGAITILMRIVRSLSFLPFAVYRVILGGALLGLIYSGTPLGAVN